MTLIIDSGYTTTFADADVQAYLTAVETADNQALEYSTAVAINDFVLGCKNDGIWSAIKASCILAGARTLSGALVPLVGTAPTNFNFVSGDYNRKTGLVGDGSTKYLNSNRNNNVDPQNNKHVSIYSTAAPSAINYLVYIGASVATTGGSLIQLGGSGNGSSSDLIATANTSNISRINAEGRTLGFKGVSRVSATSAFIRSSSTLTSVSTNSSSPTSDSILVYATAAPTATAFIDARLAFYSIGESLDLAKLDARVSALITAIGAAF